MNSGFLRKILHTIEKFRMLNKGDRVLIGFSGGADSMALLHILYDLQDLLGIKLYAFHINHQLRAQAADKDEKFARQICKKLNVPFVSQKVDCKRFAKKHKLSLEEGARVMRYNYLIKTALKLDCNKIAIGHHANDNLETVILNLVRGTGMAGLAGIPPKRDNIIRPLIETDHNEILSYLKKHRLTYCYDLTNLELGHRRNYIRYKIIPLLEKLNPNVVETIMRNSQIVRSIDNDIIQMAKHARQTLLKTDDKGRIKLDIKKLLSYNYSIQREIIKEILPTLEFKEIESLLELTNKPSGKRLEINPDICVWKEYNYLHIIKNIPKILEPINKTWKVNIGKATKIPDLGLELFADFKKGVKMSFDDNSALFDKSQIALPLSIRLRKPGDRFIPFKGKEKKLKDILIDDKIPVRMRDQLPLLCDANNILWIIGSRRSNIGLITNKIKECLKIKVRKMKLN